jgi:hypothetical protein
MSRLPDLERALFDAAARLEEQAFRPRRQGRTLAMLAGGAVAARRCSPQPPP